jgi:DNA polymerase III subunit beta
MAATDGFRLSVRDAKLPAPVAEAFQVVIPARALIEAARVLSDDAEAVLFVLAGRP